MNDLTEASTAIICVLIASCLFTFLSFLTLICVFFESMNCLWIPIFYRRNVDIAQLHALSIIVPEKIKLDIYSF